jgi:hypothetical protein
MWRVILRISYTGDFGSGLRNNIVPIFQALGLQHTATGTFESPAVDAGRAADHLSLVLRAIANPRQFPEVHAQSALKHLWVYIDRVVEA